MQKEAKVSVKTEETSEIRFVINTYEDIFSDFDPRPYSLKVLSEDFLSAAKGSLTNKPIDKIDFIFLVQKKERKEKEEAVIKERLKKHFKKHMEIFEKEKSKIVKRGSIFTGVGMILMLTATFLFLNQKKLNLIWTSTEKCPMHQLNLILYNLKYMLLVSIYLKNILEYYFNVKPR